MGWPQQVMGPPSPTEFTVTWPLIDPGAGAVQGTVTLVVWPAVTAAGFLDLRSSRVL